MNAKYEVRPDGPVVCKECASNGHTIEMEPYAENVPDYDPLKRSYDGLESYRCPNCESIRYFRIG